MKTISSFFCNLIFNFSYLINFTHTMNKKRFLGLFLPLKKLIATFPEFLSFFSQYIKEKVISFSKFFETNKNILVRFFTMKRGRYSRPFLHFAAMIALTIGVIIAPFLANTYPVFSQNTVNNAKIVSSLQSQSITIGEDVFQTQISQKPRDKVIKYTVQKGDTISTVADKFAISADTIRWENNLSDDSLSVGDTLDIPPVTGVVYKVQSGDSVYTIAKKFDTNAQKIVDFPFNDFANPETFSLVNGQMLIVPDGIKPSDQPFTKQEAFITYGPQAVSSSGFSWPVRGVLTQLYSWYHQAIDIGAAFNTPIYSSTNGTVVEVLVGGWNTGYGNTVVVDNGNGYTTRYSHMNVVNVSVGSPVEAGKTEIGSIGMTGRTTGPHVDFRVTHNGEYVNPMSLLR